MARPCSVCRHFNREGIDAALAQGVSCRAVAQAHALDATSVSRHNRAHRSPAPAPIATPAATATAQSLQTVPIATRIATAADGRSLREHDTDTGRFLPLDREAIESKKKAVLESLYRHGKIKQACEDAGLAVGTLYLLAQADLELQEAMEASKSIRALELEGTIDAILTDPNKPEHEPILLHPNLMMFRQKYLNPGYRDNVQVNVNVDNRRISIGDWQSAVRAIEAEHPA